MLKYQQARICHSRGPLILFCCFEESTWKTITDCPPRAASQTDYSLLNKHTLARERWLFIMPEGTIWIPDMCLLLYVVILQKNVVTIVWYCIQIPFLLFVIYYLVLAIFASKPKCFYFVWCRDNKLYKGMYQTDSCKGKRTFICTNLKWDYLFFKWYCT